jgi:hypothetical protein
MSRVSFLRNTIFGLALFFTNIFSASPNGYYAGRTSEGYGLGIHVTSNKVDEFKAVFKYYGYTGIYVGVRTENYTGSSSISSSNFNWTYAASDTATFIGGYTVAGVFGSDSSVTSTTGFSWHNQKAVVPGYYQSHPTSSPTWTLSYLGTSFVVASAGSRSIDNISSSGMRFNWTNASGAYSTQMRTYNMSNYSYGSIYSSFGSSNSFNGLSPGTYYRIESRSLSAFDTSSWVYNYAYTSPSAPTISTISALDDDKVRITWSSLTGYVSSYQIERATDTLGTWAQVASIASTVTADTILSHTPGTKYYYRMRAYNGSYSSYSTIKYVNMPPAKLTGIVANSENSTSLTLGFNNCTGCATKYFYISTTGAVGSFSYKTNTASTSSVSLTGLASNTDYYITGRGYSGSVFGVYSDTIVARTAPSAPTGLTVSSPNFYSARLHWTASAGATKYRIYRRLGAGAYSLIDSTTVTTYLDDKLSSGSLYYYYLQAVSLTNLVSSNSTASSVTVPLATVAGFPYFSSFESGAPTSEWTFTSSDTAKGRIAISSLNSPYDGSYHLIMDVNTDNYWNQNDGILAVNLYKQDNVDLNLFQKESGDEDHVMPLTCVGSCLSDAVSMSVDGVNWYKLIGLTLAESGSGSTWKRLHVDIDSAALALGLTLNSRTFFKFSQYDNFTYGSDGIAFDNIDVDARPAITVTAGSNGSASPIGVNYYPKGSSQRIIFTPSTNYIIDSVIVDGVKVDSVSGYTFTDINSNHSLNVQFKLRSWNITATAGANGSVSPSGTVSVIHGESESFTFTPATGYKIASVYENGIYVGNTSPRIISNVTSNRTLNVNFEIQTFTLSVNKFGTGTITPATSQIVNYGSDQVFSIVPGVGQKVDSVVVDGVKTDSTSSFTFSNITENHSLNVYFSPLIYTITASSGTNGSISPSGNVSIAYGGSQLFTFTPSSGYKVQAVYENGVYVGNSSTRTLSNVTADGSIEVVFTPITYNITASSGSNGSISPSGSVLVNHGNSQLFTFNPAIGYKVDQVLVDGVYVGDSATHTITTVTSDHDIEVSFTPITYTITVSSDANGSVTPLEGAVVVNYGSDTSFSFVPASGYEVDSILVNGVYRGDSSSFRFINVTSAQSLSVVFAKLKFLISRSFSGSGSLSPGSDAYVDYGTDYRITVNPGVGQKTDSILVDGALTDSLSGYTFEAVSAPHSLEAFFSPIQYTLTASAGSNGSISPSGSILVDHGSSQVFTITPESGYMVDSVLVNGVNIGAVSSYTFVDVESAGTIAAFFKLIPPTLYNITALANSNGSLSPAGVNVVTAGNSIRIVSVPTTGYQTDSLVVDGVKVDSLLGYTFSNVNANHSIESWYKLQTRTITVSSDANGSVTPLEGAVVVNYGSDTSFSFVPATGYEVDSILVNGVYRGDSSSFRFINVTSAQSLSVVFAKQKFLISRSFSGSGSLSPGSDAYVDYGTDYRITVNPGVGQKTDSILVDGALTDSLSGYTFEAVSAPHSLEAFFSPIQYTLTASAGSNGSISPSGSILVDHGSSQVFNITPESGYMVDSVVVNGVNIGAVGSYSYTDIDNDGIITATFMLIPPTLYNISAVSGTNGTLSPSGITVVAEGASIRIASVPATGYQTDSLVVNGVKVDSLLGYTFSNVNANHSIESWYKLQTRTITVSSDANGSVTPLEGAVVVNYGSDTSFSFVPATGYEVDSILVNGVYRGDSSSFRFINVTSAQTLSVKFAKQKFLISRSFNGSGSLSPGSNATVDYGTDYRIAVNPGVGQKTDSILVDGALTDSLSGYTFEAVAAPHSLEAFFSPIQYTLTASAGANGSISPSGSVLVDHGSSQAFTITPESGYMVDSVVVNGVNIGAVSSYTFVDVESTGSVAAFFKLIPPTLYNITALANSNGALSPAGVNVVTAGNSIRIVSVPATGYQTDSLVVNGVKVDSLLGYTFSNVNANHSIESWYKLQTRTITVSSDANGSVTPLEGAVVVNYGSDTSFSFVPATGYEVDSILVNGVYRGDSSSFRFINVTSAQTLSVKFAKQKFLISRSFNGSGSLSPGSNATVDYGTDYRIAVNPGVGQKTDSILVDGALTDSLSGYTFEAVAAPHSLEAFFSPIQYTLTASAGANGSISPSGSVLVDHGSSQAFTITPESGYMVDSVVVNGVNIGAVSSYTFVDVESTGSVAAFFKLIPPTLYNITALANSNGALSPAGVNVVTAGNSIRIVSVPATGYQTDSLVVNGVKVDSLLGYTFSNVNANHSIESWYKLQTRTITVSSDANGSVTPLEGAVVVNYGSDTSFSFVPATGYEVDSILVNGVYRGDSSSFRFINVTSAQTLSVKFAKQKFLISRSFNGSGSLSPGSNATVDYGTDYRIAVNPGVGQKTDSILVDGALTDSLSGYTFEAVSTPHSLEAFFSPIQYTLTASAGANGSISPSGSVLVDHGSSQVFNITPESGYMVDSVLVNGVNIGAVSSYTFVDVESTGSVAAFFKLIPPTLYNITALANSNGALSPAGVNVVTAGNSIRIVSVPATGYQTDSLVVNGVKVDSLLGYTFSNVNANHSIESWYKLQTRTITVSSDANGSVTPLEGAVVLNYGSNMTFNFVPTTGYEVDSILVNGVYRGDSSSFRFINVISAQTLSVKFAKQKFLISRSFNGSGSLSPGSNATVDYGTDYRIAVNPGVGQKTDSILVDGALTDSLSGYTFEAVSAPHNLEAFFSPIQYTLTASAGANGSISPSGSVLVDHGSSQAFTITPESGYMVDSVVVNGVNIGAVSSYTFNNVTGSATINIHFGELPPNVWTITVLANANGSLTPAGAISVVEGDNLSVTSTPFLGYKTDSLKVDGVLVDSIQTYTFSNVNADHSLEAWYSPQIFTVSVTTSAGGSVNPSGDTLVIWGSALSYAINPDSGYLVDSVFVDGIWIGAPTTYDFTSVESAHTLYVKFKLREYQITTSVIGMGTISPSSDLVSHGSSSIFTLSPNVGYKLDSLSLDGVLIDSTTSLTLNNVNSNHQIDAWFSKISLLVSVNSNGGGVVNPGVLNNISFGDTLVLQFTPNLGYKLDSLKIEGVLSDSTSSLSLFNIQSNIDIDVWFSKQTFIINAGAGNHGSISPSGLDTVEWGDSRSYSLIADAGYLVDSIWVNSEYVGSGGVVNLTNIQEDQSIYVQFVEEPAITFSVNATSNGNGSISPSGASTVIPGGSLNFTLTPIMGYKVDSLLVGGVNQGALTSYTLSNIQADYSLQAFFGLRTQTITASASANGTISPSGITGVTYGNSASFTFQPNPTYRVQEVLVDGAPVDSSTGYSFYSVQANHTIQVSFAPITHEISITSGGNGSATPSGIYSANEGSSLEVDFHPLPGYMVDSVIVDGTYIGAPGSYTFTNILVPHTLRVSFVEIPAIVWQITASAGPMGQVSPSGVNTLAEGSQLRIQFQPNIGYLVDSVVVDGTKVDSTTGYTFLAVDADHSLMAWFKPKLYNIDVSAFGMGSLSGGDTAIFHGEDLSFSFLPNPNSKVDSALINGVHVDSLAGYTFRNVSAHQSLQVYFSLISHPILVNVSVGGSASIEGWTMVNSGSEFSFSALPNQGYEVSSIRLNGVETDSIRGLTLAAVTQDSIEIFIQFELQQFEILVMTEGSGSVENQSGLDRYAYYSSEKFVFTPAAGWVVDSVSVDGTEILSKEEYEFLDIDQNHSLYVRFSLLRHDIAPLVTGSGQIIPLTDFSVISGEGLRFLIVPDPGFKMDSIAVNDYIANTMMVGDTLVLTDITEDISIRAWFSELYYQVKTEISSGDGFVIPGLDIQALAGGNVVLEFIAGTGHVLNSIYLNGTLVQDHSLLLTLDNIQHDQDIVVSFSPATYQIRLETQGYGELSGLDTILSWPDSWRVSFNPYQGQMVGLVLLNGEPIDSLDGFTFDSVHHDQLLQVNFVPEIIAEGTARIIIDLSDAVRTIAREYIYIPINTDTTFSFNPPAGYTLLGIEVNGVFYEGITEWTFNSNDSDIHLRLITEAITSVLEEVRIQEFYSIHNNFLFFNNEEVTSLVVANIAGQVQIFKSDINIGETINLNSLKSGVYLIQIENSLGVHQQTWLKK